MIITFIVLPLGLFVTMLRFFGMYDMTPEAATQPWNTVAALATGVRSLDAVFVCAPPAI